MSEMITGYNLNQAIMTMMDPSHTAGSNDENVKTITFNKVNTLPSSGIDVSAANDGSVILTHDGNDVYINFTTDKIKATDYSPSYMFSGFLVMTNIYNLNRLDVSDAQWMSSMFNQCHDLRSVDLTNFNTPNVRTFSSMFTDCYELQSLDLSKFNTANAYSMVTMFQGCRNLTSLNVSSFNTSKV